MRHLCVKLSLLLSCVTIESGSEMSTEAPDTMAATGAEIFTGTIASTEAIDTCAASGTEVFTGTIARTESADTSAASGTEVFTGTIAATEAVDTCASSGQNWDPTKAGQTLAAWYRFDSIVHSGSNATAWNDKSGNSRNLTASTTNPTYNAATNNGHDEVQFVRASGTDMHLSNTDLSSSGVYTMFLVLKADTNNVNQHIFGNTSASGGESLAIIGASTARDITHPTKFDATDGAVSTGVWEYWVVTRASGAAPTFYKNSVSQTLSGTTTTFTDPGGGASLHLGAFFNGAYNNQFNGRIQEAGLYQGVLSAGDLTNLFTYLQDLHALPTS